MRASFALTEPHAGSDAGAIKTRAVREGDEWIINGQKFYSSGATAADFITLAAKTDPEAGVRGITVFVVPTDAPGFRIGPPRAEDGDARGCPPASSSSRIAGSRPGTRSAP